MNQRLKGGLLFLLLGIGFAVGGSVAVYDHVQTTVNSEEVDVEVLSSEWTSTSAGGQQQTDYRVAITYRFAYDGDEYTSESVFPGGRNTVSAGSRAREIADRYGAGDEVTGYVANGDPAQSYLIESDVPWWYYLFPVFGVVLLLLGLLNVVQGIRGKGPQIESG